MVYPANKIENVKRRVKRARRFPINTCPASRFVNMIADNLVRKGRKHNIEEIWEPEHMAGSLYSVVESLWKARTKIEKLEAALSAQHKD